MRWVYSTPFDKLELKTMTVKGIKLKLCKLEPGYYKTADNRFWIRDTYYPGTVGCHRDKRWLIEDRSGAKPFQLLNLKVSTQRVYTLTEAKETIALIYQRDEEHQKLLDYGYLKSTNTQFPGICWLSPKTGQLLTRSEALLELMLCQ